MSDPNLIADLIRAGTDPDLVQRVALELSRLSAEASAISKRRASDRERQARYRNVTSRDEPPPDGGVTTSHVTERYERDAPPLPPKPPIPTRTHAAQPREAGERVGVPENWEPRPEVFEFVVQHWVLKGSTATEAREKAHSEVQRYRDFSRSRGLTYADLDAGFKEWATKHNAPHHRRQSSPSLTVVNGARTHAAAQQDRIQSAIDRRKANNPYFARRG